VLNETPISSNQSGSVNDRQPSRVEAISTLPDVPVLPETLLMLDLLVQESCVDLRQMSEMVLVDFGATLQILRLAGREYGMAADRPVRIADCIADLGLRACLKSVSAQTVGRQGRKREIAEFWEHALTVAVQSRLVAQDMPDIDPEEAYLAGIFHGLGSLPALLGWREYGASCPEATALRLAKAWSLPVCVTELCTEMQASNTRGHWSSIVREAHLCSTRSSIDCPFEHDIRPHLHRIAVGE
jgi:HD-like signal output (HDOD) protein